LFTGIVEDLGEVEALEHLGDFARIYVRSGVVTQDARTGDSICVNGVCLTVTGFLPPGGAAPRTPSEQPPAAATLPAGFTADVMGETLRHSSLKSLAQGTKVNLERSVRLEDRLGGHLVQGHTDGTATIVSRDPQEHWEVVRITLPAGLARYIVHKGSVAVDGISLTVSALSTGGATPPNSPEAALSPGGATSPNPPEAALSPGGATSPNSPEAALSPGGATPSNPPETKTGEAGGAGGAGGDADWFEVSLIPETLKRTTLGTKQPGAEVNLEVDVVAKYVEKLIGGTR
jgi:riboflavin synthase